MAVRSCNVLLVYPRFAAYMFRNSIGTCEIFGARDPAAPLGLIPVAALLPPSGSVRLVDRNLEELADRHLGWADLVMTGGMLPQHSDLITVIELCRTRGKPIANGGPAVTSSPHLYRRASLRGLGETEGVIDTFIAAWESGAREGMFEAEK